MTLDNVGFRYRNRPENKVLEDVTLSITPGKMTAFVGQSGSGKSTVGLLLQRLYDPEEGRVYLGRHMLHATSPASLRSRIAYVEQEPKLFEGTIRENIRYGLRSASASDIEDVAAKAGVSDFVSAFPDGLDTRIGKFGKGLSGGQKQRVAIARALVKKPHVLILDEATSALDVTAEHRILSSVSEHLNQSTVVVIAHRLSAVREADQIVVMEQGRVVEVGSPSGLCANPGSAFAQLFQHSNR
jgi:ABC-type multidrug transport system fused ATPase/permease subunit